MNRTTLKIVVLRGSQKGEEFYLTKRITRLGSDAGCEIQINGDGIIGHALSIDAGGEEIVIYNRGETPLTVAGQSVAPLMSGVWKQGKDLLLPGQVQLRLETYSAAVVAPKKLEYEEVVEARPDMLGETTTTPKLSTKPRKNNAGAIAFIAACLVLVVLMIIKKTAGDSTGPIIAGKDVLTWEKVWVELNDEKRLADPKYDDLRRGFQYLYRLQNNRNSPEIPRWKSRVLQTLIASESDKKFDQAFPQQLRAFVNKL
ncbi:MAG: FHA domain-containing protein [Planctomycetota bacterium]